MTRPVAVAGSILFFLLAPGTVAGLVPWWITGWDVAGANPAMMAAGGALVVAGLALLVACFGRFALDGLGTPAPVAPTRTLVVGGPYRFVRNPMYIAVLAIILGQALLFSSAPLIAYGVVIWLAFQTFILMYEEPTLRVTYGEAYIAWCAAVPRWIPRLRPWTP